MGEYIRQLLDDIKYYGTILRRIPVKLARELKKKMIIHDMNKAKAEDNDTVKGELEVGMKCKAKYSDGQYYDVVIDEITKDGKFVVTWNDYGTQDELEQDAFKVDRSSKGGKGGGSSRRSDRERSKSKSKSRSRRSGSRHKSKERGKKKKRSRSDSSEGGRKKENKKRSTSRSQSPKRSSARKKSKSPDSSGADIEKEILRQEREAALAQGTDYARKPVGYKKALSLQLTVGTARKRSRSRSRSRDRGDRDRGDRDRGDRDRGDRDRGDRDRGDRGRDRRDRERDRQARQRSVSPPRKKELSAAAKAQMAKLKEIYGDASGGKNAKKEAAGPNRQAKVDSEEVVRLGF